MEQKEKNNAVKEFLKRFLESAKCSPEMIDLYKRQVQWELLLQ